MNQRELSNWLKIIILISGFFGLLICFVLAPRIGKNILGIHKSMSFMYWPCLIFMWIGCIPIYLGFYQGWKIFDNIGKDKSFSEENVVCLYNIVKLSIMEIILFSMSIVILLFLNVNNIAMYIVIFLVLFVSIFVGTSSAILSHLINKAIELKRENDLTI